MPVRGIGAVVTGATLGRIQLTIQGRSEDRRSMLKVRTLVIPRIAGDVPAAVIPSAIREYPAGFNLADPQFGSPGEIDMLLGADVLEKVWTGERRVFPSKPTLYGSIFGWVVMGATTLNCPPAVKALACHQSYSDLDVRRERWWEVEDLPLEAERHAYVNETMEALQEGSRRKKASAKAKHKRARLDPQYQKSVSQIQKEISEKASQEFRVQEVNEQADKLIGEGHPEREIILKRKEEVNDTWQRLKALTLLKQEKLFGAHEIQRFNRDADETIAWITEKDLVLSSDDYGRDLVSVQTLQRKHEGIERDLAALEDKVMTLAQEADRLCNIHQDHAGQIQSKNAEISSNWEMLKAKAQERRRRLDESYLLHRFLADFRDLVSWIHDMKAIISADELAKDVAGAEALLERHQEHKGEIVARGDSFRATAEAGKMLLDQDHFAVEEVKEKLVTLVSEKRSLLSLWEERRILYEQCVDLQLFYRDTEQADTWMAKQEAFLVNEDLGDSLDSVEALIKKHEDFEKSLAAQEEKIKALNEFATKLIEGQYYAVDDVAQRRAALLEKTDPQIG